MMRVKKRVQRLMKGDYGIRRRLRDWLPLEEK